MDDISRELGSEPRPLDVPHRRRGLDAVDAELDHTTERDLFAEVAPRVIGDSAHDMAAPLAGEDADCAEVAAGAEDAAVEGDSSAGEPDDDANAAVPVLQDAGEVARVVLALLLTSREPVSLLRLAQVCNTSQAAIVAGVERLEHDLRGAGMPLLVSRSGDNVQILTVPEVFPFLRRLQGVKRAERLSHAALETLAVIAYRQPVMRAEIEAIRGVKVGPMLRTLLEHKLVAVVARADVPGRPLQYGTTPTFLDRFGLASLKDLPSIREFKAL